MIASVPPRGGWVRFDFIVKDGNLSLYIDGIFASKLVEGGAGVNMMSVNFRYVDEYSFNPNPDSFRPNPVKSIMPDSTFGEMILKPAQKMDFDIQLDPKGLVEGDVLELSMISKRGDVLAKTEKVVSNGDTVKMQLPAPARSGHFTLQTSYRLPNLNFGDLRRLNTSVNELD